MARPSIEQMFAWANSPPEWQYAGFASSQEDFDELRDFSVEMRRAFLREAAQREFGRRALGDTPLLVEASSEAKFDFDSLPLVRTISLKDCEVLAAICQYKKVMLGERTGWDGDDAKSYWRSEADVYARLNGHTYESPKFSDRIFKPWNPHYKASDEELDKIAEEHFEQLLERANRVTKQGYMLRFLTDGVLRLEDACLDVHSLELMVKSQRRRGEDGRYFQNRDIKFWSEILAAKHEFDRKGPYKEKATYADVVDELAPGVYSAPYIDPALVASKQFISIDDWRRAVLSVDNGEDMGRLVKGFNIAIAVVAKEDRFYTRPYTSQSDVFNSHGAVFFDRSLLAKALDFLEYSKSGKFIVPMLEYLLHENDGRDGADLDENELQVVFGERAISADAAEVARRIFSAASDG
jgi:hypothetical protein